MTPGAFIWKDNAPGAHVSHVFFRRALALAGKPTVAEIHLSARTQYHLKVNGVFVGCGPARAYPEFREYDTYDLAPFLRSGQNVVAVDVLHYGVATYHYLPTPPGFVAWGSIVDGDGVRHDLATDDGWKCLASKSCDSQAPAFSFAIGPIQIEDARHGVPGWDVPDFDDAAWETPVALAGVGRDSLRPRQIPPLTCDEIAPERMAGIFAHAADEDIVSFRVNQEYDRANHGYPDETTFAYTYIFSPDEQEVVVGIWWGEHYLNGRLLHKAPVEDGRLLREKAVMSLHKGWNTFFVSYRMTYGVWEFHLALPTGKGLVLSVAKDEGDSPSFHVAGPLPMEAGHRILGDNPWDDPAQAAGLSSLWRRTVVPSHPVSPIRMLAWLKEREFFRVDAGKLCDFHLPAGQGHSLLFDFGNIVLGRIFVEYTAPAGTVIDVGYAEEARGGRPHYGKNFLVNAAERQVAAGGRARMETFFPRGFRHLEVAVHGHDAPVQVHRVGIVSQVYPLVQRGSFTCSDPLFNTLWEYGWRTLRLCSEDVITDCPWRERTLYGGDLLAEMATMAVTAGDMRLVKRSIEVFLQSQNPETGWLQSMAPMRRDRIPLYEYPVLVLIGLEWYCRLSGDAEFAERAYPVFHALLARALASREPGGLFPAVHPVFIEHHYPAAKEGCVCAFNALMAGAFRAWARLLAMLGRADEAEAAASLAAEIAEAVNRDFWSPGHSAYMDAIVDGNFSAGHGIAASAWTMAFAGIPPERVASVAAPFRAAMPRFDPDNEVASVSAYGMFYWLAALYQSGLEEDAEAWMKVVYRDMVDHPTGTIWEHANPTKSLTHAWSTAPNFYLSTRALGVRLGFPEPGAAGILIAPQSETLSWAEGVVPHPLGEVFVKWRVEEDRLVLEYRCPEGVEPKIAPVGRLARFRLEVERLDSHDPPRSPKARTLGAMKGTMLIRGDIVAINAYE